MRKLVTFLLVFGLLAWAMPATAGILFYDNCEDKWDTKYWKESHTDALNNSLTVSSEQARAGRHSYKFYLMPWTRANDWASNNGLNLYWATDIQQGQKNNFQHNKEYWLGYSVFVPANQQQPYGKATGGDGSEWLCFSQFHGMNEPCDQLRNPNVSLSLKQDASWRGYQFSLHGDSRACTPSTGYGRDIKVFSTSPASSRYPSPSSLQFTRGKWHDVVFNFKFSYDSSKGPFIKLWIDGVLAIDDQGINCYNDSIGPYWIMGPYGHMNEGTVVYFDEIRVGDAGSNYSQVAPAGGATQVVNAPSPSSLEPPVLSINPTN
jgi:hypothetical protein